MFFSAPTIAAESRTGEASPCNGGCCRGQCPHTEFWVIDTHCAPTCCGMETGIDRIVCRRFSSNCQWQEVPLAEFLTAPPMITVIHAHGNGQSYNEGMKTARQFHGKLKNCACASFRFVLWSWPSEGGARKVKDLLQVHARWADCQGYYLARVVAQMSNRFPINLSGHSLGAMVTASALHFLGGGSICGRALADPPPLGFYDLRCVHMAGAVDNDLMLPGRRYGMAFSAASRVVMGCNAEDRLLKLWPLISFRGASAAGVTGLASPHLLGEHQRKYSSFCAAQYVGRRHTSVAYFDSQAVADRFCRVFFAPPTPAAEHVHEGLPLQGSAGSTSPGDCNLSSGDVVQLTLGQELPVAKQTPLLDLHLHPLRAPHRPRR